MTGWFGLPRVVWFGLAERDGRAVGYADVQLSDSHTDVDARALDPDAVSALVRASVERATPGLPVWGYAPATDEPAAAAYAAEGFSVIRYSFTMLTQFDVGAGSARVAGGSRREAVAGG